MPEKPLIREASKSDIHAIATLVGQYWAFEKIEGFESGRISALLENIIGNSSLGKLWIAETEGGLCGYLLVTFIFSLEHGGVMAQIDEFYVTEGHRALGIGHELLEKSDSDLNALSIVRIELQLGRDNSKARQFYHRHGFVERDGYELLDKPLAAINGATEHSFKPIATRGSTQTLDAGAREDDDLSFS